MKAFRHIAPFTTILGVLCMSSPSCDAAPKDTENKRPDASPAVAAAAIGPMSGHDIPADIKAFLLKLARDNVEASVKGLPAVVPAAPPAPTTESRGCFVTLTKQGRLRGCIGYIEPIMPLFEAVIDNAKNAALQDPRFAPVAPPELSEIKIEVSVLTKPEPIEYKDSADLLGKIVAGVDGLILTKGQRQSTYLPQVWEQLPDKVQFLESLSVKGGMPPDGWKTANVKRYRAIHFQEQ
jgi:AmmeMemoRadiSam system protein A